VAARILPIASTDPSARARLRQQAEAQGSLAWTLDALTQVGGWAEAVEGRPGLTRRGTDDP
jgi:hypothetical protein